MSQIQLGTYRVMFTWSRGGTESGYRMRWVSPVVELPHDQDQINPHTSPGFLRERVWGSVDPLPL